jgi:hypothetical protein
MPPKTPVVPLKIKYLPSIFPTRLSGYVRQHNSLAIPLVHNLRSLIDFWMQIFCVTLRLLCPSKFMSDAMSPPSSK